MIGDISIKVGRRVYSARLEYDSLIGRRLAGIRQGIEAKLNPLAGAIPPFSMLWFPHDPVSRVYMRFLR